MKPFFPEEKYNIKLTHKDNKEKKTCWFSHKSHLEKYMKRYNLKKNDVLVETSK
jgi:hypothetical protein